MAEWSTLDKSYRDDDPYHGWEYLQRVDPESGDVVGGDALCPVVIELWPESGPLQTLKESLNWLLRHIEETDAFSISAYDRKHLVESLAAVERRLEADTGAEIEPSSRYGRIFVLYGLESYLFPRQDSVWDVVADDLPRYSIRYAGRAIRDPKTMDALREGESGDPGTKADLVVIDDSIAFLNQEFRWASNNSRFTEIWFQDRERIEDGLVVTGARLDSQALKPLIARIGTETEREIYESDAIGKDGNTFRPIDLRSKHHQPLAYELSHGTHVASTALRALSGEDRDSLGLYGITVPSDVTQDTSGASLGSYLITAIRQAMLWNDAHYNDGGKPVPLVINCSYGFLAGAKDGSDTLSWVIADMLEARNAYGRPTALVLPMGNEFEARGVATKILEQGVRLDVDWILQPDDGTPNFLEIYAKGSGSGKPVSLNLAVTAPYGAEPFEIAFDGSGLKTWRVVKGDPGVRAGWREWETHGSDWERKGVLSLGPTASLEHAENTAPAGRWSITLENPGEETVELWMFVQRDDAPGTYPEIGRQSFLETDETAPVPVAGDHDQITAPMTQLLTASNLASINSPYVFVAGAGAGNFAINDGSLPDKPSRYAAAGPRGAHKLGPDFSELADRSDEVLGIYGAATYSGTDILMNGSSVAAPKLAARLIANPELIPAAGEQNPSKPTEEQTEPPDLEDLRFGAV